LLGDTAASLASPALTALVSGHLMGNKTITKRRQFKFSELLPITPHRSDQVRIDVKHGRFKIRIKKV